MSESDDERFARHGAEWRDPAQVVAQWGAPGPVDARALDAEASGDWWDVLAGCGVTLIVSREYEHLLLAIDARAEPRISYLRIPHPSGVVFDHGARRLYVASTRNPNGIVELAPVASDARRPLVPTRSWYLPGSSYVHDLAMIGPRLHANAVGRNMVVMFRHGTAVPVWWPASVERDGAPRTDRNYLQLNSIAAGPNLRRSFFTASCDRPGDRVPGEPDFPVDGRGVVFSGATREPVVRGLTRPHSARLHEGRLWIDNSGYGEVGLADNERFAPIARLPGWTRGLGFAGGVAFAGTSRVIPRFRAYAPGLDVDRSTCAIHALDARTGRVLGALTFASGNQIFAVEPVPAEWTSGFPFHSGAGDDAVRDLFYAYRLD